jgi:hypothetical protein
MQVKVLAKVEVQRGQKAGKEPEHVEKQTILSHQYNVHVHRLG